MKLVIRYSKCQKHFTKSFSQVYIELYYEILKLEMSELFKSVSADSQTFGKNFGLVPNSNFPNSPKTQVQNCLYRTLRSPRLGLVLILALNWARYG